MSQVRLGQNITLIELLISSSYMAFIDGCILFNQAKNKFILIKESDKFEQNQLFRKLRWALVDLNWSVQVPKRSLIRSLIALYLKVSFIDRYSEFYYYRLV